MMTRARVVARVGALVAAGLVASACGGTTADPLAPYRNQALSWAPCDPTIVPPGQQAALASLGSRATCAMMRAPIDYANPSGGEVEIAFLRVAAGDATRRRGAILFNPGGPGDDGLFLAPLFGALWANADPADPVGALYVELSRTHDVIGFSPRGTGASTQLSCDTSEQMSFVANAAIDRSPANVDAMLRNGRLQAEGCGKNPLTPFVNSDATARDMDLLREILRDAKISYFGLSYGTWLGAWYASLFPERVDRMVLSGVADLTVGLGNTFVLQPKGIQYVMDELHAPYAALHPDVYLLGSTADEVRAVYGRLRMQVKEALNPLLVGGMGSEGARDRLLRALLAAKVLDGMLSAVPPPVDAYAAYAGVDGAVAFVPDDGRRSDVRDLVNQLIPACFDIADQAVTKVEMTGKGATLWSVICNDTPWAYDVASWVRLQDRLAALYPIQGGTTTGSPCLYWGGPSVVRPPLSNLAAAGPILLTQTEFDPQTPLEGALASFAALPTTSLIQVDGGWNHGVLVPSGNPCVDLPVAEYLLRGKVPASRETHCANGGASASAGVFDAPPVTDSTRSPSAAPAPAGTGRRSPPPRGR